MTDQHFDPDLAARIRASVDRRIAAQVQAARARIGDKRAVRDSFARSREAGVQHRNAARAARLGLIAHHDSKETTVTRNTTTKPDYLKLADALVAAVITDTTNGLGIGDEGNSTDIAVNEIMNSESCGELGGAQLSLIVALADYAGKAVIDLAGERSQAPESTWATLSDPFVQGGHVGPVSVVRNDEEHRVCHLEGDINTQLDSLTVAAGRLIEDYSDVVVRGCLKEHPGYIAHRLDLVTAMAAQVRAAVAKEMTKNPWPPVESEAVADHQEETARYARHSCGCPFCLHAR